MNIKAILASIISGILLSLAWSAIYLDYFIFIAFLPLFILENRYKSNNHTLRIYSFTCFCVWNIISCWWISQAHLMGMLMIVLISSLLMSIIFSYANYLSNRYKFSFPAIYIVLVLSYEFLNSKWDLHFPWLNIGYALSNRPKLIQWYEYTGFSGGSLWILLINYIIFGLYQNINNYKRIIKQTLLLLTIIFIPICISMRIYNIHSSDYKTKSYTLIQTNTDPYTEKFNSKINHNNINIFLNIIDSVSYYNKDYVFGSETQIIDAIDENNKTKSEVYNRLIEKIKKHKQTSYIIGCNSKRYTNNTKYKLYNSAMFINNNRETTFYHKTKLVPLFEKIPFGEYIPFMEKYQISIAGCSSIYDNDQQTHTFKSADSTEIIPLICYESVFSEFTSSKIINNNYSFISIIVNDGWWKNTTAYIYHLNLCRIRAIENRREILRTANTGISAHINSKGIIIAKTKWWTKACLSGDVKLYNIHTFYNKFGNYIGILAFIISIFIIVFDNIKKLLIKIKNKTHE